MRQAFVTGVYASGLKHVLHVAVCRRWHRHVFKIVPYHRTREREHAGPALWRSLAFFNEEGIKRCRLHKRASRWIGKHDDDKVTDLPVLKDRNGFWWKVHLSYYCDDVFSGPCT